MARTLAQQLEDLDNAIERIEKHGQSSNASGRSFTQADLDTLYRQRERLERKINRSSGFGRTVAEF